MRPTDTHNPYTCYVLAKEREFGPLRAYVVSDHPHLSGAIAAAETEKAQFKDQRYVVDLTPYGPRPTWWEYTLADAAWQARGQGLGFAVCMEPGLWPSLDDRRRAADG